MSVQAQVFIGLQIIFFRLVPPTSGLNLFPILSIDMDTDNLVRWTDTDNGAYSYLSFYRWDDELEEDEGL